MFNRYFNDELRDLRELGKAFGRKHPEAGRLLDEFAYDPDVERFLEGVAFLTARIRQKLDDEIPELTHGLIQILWPHYLRPTPSMSILEFVPRPGMVKAVQRIERGTQVLSIPKDGTACTFRTAFDVLLAPIWVRDVHIAHPSAGARHLHVVLALDKKGTITPGSLPRLRFYLHGQREVATLLYYWLLRKTRHVWLETTAPGGERRRWDLPPGAIQPGGWGEEETLLDYGPNVSRGHQILQEFFTLPEKYLFVDVVGLETVPGALDAEAVDVVFQLEEDIPAHAAPSPDNIRLHCTPIVNLFPSSARPVRLDPLQHEYRVQVDESPSEHFEVFSIDTVTSFARGTAERKLYRPIFELEDPAGETGSTPGYMVHLKPAVLADREAADIYLSLSNPYGTRGSEALQEEETAGAPEYLSIDVTATNAHLPEGLKAGDVCRPGQSSPPFAEFTNLTRPTSSAPPPLDRGVLWHLISLLNLNVRSLDDVQALRSLLRAYQFAARHDLGRAQYHRNLLAGLQDVLLRPGEALYRGHIVRGTTMELVVKESMFEGVGDIYLFGSVLLEFLRMNCSINTFVSLKITGSEERLVLTWSVRFGQEPLA